MRKEKEVLNKNRKKLMKLTNVVAVGIGYKVKSGKRTYKLSIVFSVTKKLPLSELKKKDVIPTEIEGVVTDVVETGIIRALKARTDRWRPAPGGVSIGHYRITAGTLGCLVFKRDDTVYILSNNHVLAESNNAAIGDQILQPGKHDGGEWGKDRIATLTDYIPIEFVGLDGCVGKIAKLFGAKQAENLVDAAIAKPVEEGLLKKEILEIGIPHGLNVTPELGLIIQKSGRTTALTKGTIEQLDVTVQVQYGEGKIAIFSDQIMAGNMCSGGDSGSAVLDTDKNLVGLLFAGSDTSTVINRIKHVFDLLDLNL